METLREKYTRLFTAPEYKEKQAYMTVLHWIENQGHGGTCRCGAGKHKQFGVWKDSIHRMAEQHLEQEI